MLAVRTAEARLAPACVEALHRLEVLAVYVRLAEFEGSHGPGDRICIGGEYGGGESHLAIVGERDRLVEATEGEHRQHGPEDLLLHDLVGLRDARQYCRLEMVARVEPGVHSATCEGFGPARDSALDHAAHLCQLLRVDQATHICAGCGRGADNRGGHLGDEAFGELLRHAFMHVDALGAVAHLAAVDDARGVHLLDREGQVGVRHHDDRRLAAQLERALGDVLRGVAHDPLADGDAAGHANDVGHC
mmetsp:Transcript_13965/g.28309  ORF Transcript_13965/g.28309 Transcript_13965/m.28309 type:complete len:247 (-) Transcript_13965:228-968(-)